MGLVPFVFSRVPHDVLEIAQITPLEDVHPGAVWSPDGPFLVQDRAEVVVPMKLPPDSRIEYELEGSGTIEVQGVHATLRKGQADKIIWRNLRIIPRTLADSGATISRE